MTLPGEEKCQCVVVGRRPQDGRGHFLGRAWGHLS